MIMAMVGTKIVSSTTSLVMGKLSLITGKETKQHMNKAWRKEHGKGKTVGVAVMGLRVNFIFVLSAVVFDVFFKPLIE